MVSYPFSLLVKPAGADCNLRCKYCFYIDHQASDPHSTRMNDKTLRQLIQSYMSTEQKNYSFGWQGGEPTVMGLKFFKKVVKYQKIYGKPGSMVSNGLQTNGTLITEEWAKFLRNYHFLVGVSLDGPPLIHNKFRKTIENKPSHAQVLAGIHNLEKFGVEFNILSLINHHSANYAKEIFEYYLDNGFFYHQYIPCVEFHAENSKRLTSYSVTTKQWGDFLCTLFDLWFPKYVQKVSIRLFDTLFEYLVHGTVNSCQFSDQCGQYFVVEHDGSIYPCDFFVEPEFYLGNIHEINWKDIFHHSTYKEFQNNKKIAIKANNCSICKFSEFCNGGCRKHHINNDLHQKDILCGGYQQFYKHALPKMKKLAIQYRKDQHIDTPVSLLGFQP